MPAITTWRDKLLGCETAHQKLPRSPRSEILQTRWKLPGSRGEVLLSPRVWRELHHLSTRDWYLKPYSNSDVTGGQDHTHSVSKRAESDGIPQVVVQYHLHCTGEDETTLAGSSVISISGLCLPFETCPSKNLFQKLFGIEFHFDGHTYVCAISTFELALWFNLIESI